jgi:hypothetical protein
MRTKYIIVLAVFALLLTALIPGCKSEQEKANDKYRARLASLKINMSESHVEAALGKSQYHLSNQPDTPYVMVYFYPSPDSSIGMAKAYYSPLGRLMKVEWDSVYLDVARGGPVQPSGRKRN